LLPPRLANTLTPRRSYIRGVLVRLPLVRFLYVVLATLLSACGPREIHQHVIGSLQLSSQTIATGAIPDKCGCKGPGVSPQISWSDPPAGTQSFVLIMDDKDGIAGRLRRHFYTHWLVFGMPIDRRELTESLPRQTLSDGTQQGKNDSGEFGYSGPCPNAGSTHHYAITVYALDSKLALPSTTRAWQLLAAIDGHILARGQLLGAYTH
jgi:Raf kinase inhibitor-like YbhB/YbcL family protein